MTKERKPKLRRVGLELNDTQLSCVPIPATRAEKKRKKPKRRLGSFWTDKY